MNSSSTKAANPVAIAQHASRRRTARIAGCLASLALACLPGLAAAGPFAACSNRVLNGRYVFTASGFTRAPASAPGTPWVPKAILEVLQFNGNGSVSTPSLTVANPFGDFGAILQPPAGAAGEYTVNADCTGTLHFMDANNVTYAIYVEPFGLEVHMIQTNPSNNVLEGSAKRQW